MDFENTALESVEAETEQEVAEPAIEEETGSKEQEVADPVSEEEPMQDHETNAAFQRMRQEKEQMRYELEEARNELAEIQAQSEARQAAFSRMTGRDGEDVEISALAELTGMSEDEVRAEIEAAQESAQKDLRIQQLENQVNEIDAERMMQADLDTLRKIDPTLKSLNDLGEPYYKYIVAGLSPEDAYWACKAREGANRATPPKPAGKVATGTAEKDYFTDAEIDAMSSDQLKKNWKKVFASWGR